MTKGGPVQRLGLSCLSSASNFVVDRRAEASSASSNHGASSSSHFRVVLEIGNIWLRLPGAPLLKRGETLGVLCLIACYGNRSLDSRTLQLNAKLVASWRLLQDFGLLGVGRADVVGKIDLDRGHDSVTLALSIHANEIKLASLWHRFIFFHEQTNFKVCRQVKAAKLGDLLVSRWLHLEVPQFDCVLLATLNLGHNVEHLRRGSLDPEQLEVNRARDLGFRNHVLQTFQHTCHVAITEYYYNL